MSDELTCKSCGAEYSYHLGVVALCAENRRLREWIGKSDLMSDYQSADHMRQEIERLRSVIRDRAKVNDE